MIGGMETAPGQRTDYVVIVNPAAGFGRCGKRAPVVIDRLRRAGLGIEVRRTSGPRDATRIAAQAFAEGYRGFIAAGGDGTCFEVLNGCFPPALEAGERVRFGVLPLGTGNSFLREFTSEGAEHSIRALTEDRRRDCDVLVFHHSAGRSYFINLFGFGFVSQVTFWASRKLKRFGALGYVLAVLAAVARLRHPVLPIRVDGGDAERSPRTLLCVCNTKYTAGDMMMAPAADVTDGLADLIVAEPIGRLDLIRTFPKIFRGTHLAHPKVSARAVRRIDFETDQTLTVMVDGELLDVVPHRIEVLSRSLDVLA